MIEAPILDVEGAECPIRVAIIGGGCAAVTAAFELTRPELGGRFSVTIYQEGWRLGGKGASGRGAAGRIEEHGLHVWFGFYENAFKLIRDCYAELEASGEMRFGRWDEAFVPEPDIGLFAAGTPGANANWQKWQAHFPPRPGLPGDPPVPNDIYSLTGYVRAALSLMMTLVLDVDVERPGDARPLPPSAFTDSGVERIVAALQVFVARGIFAGSAVLVEALALLRVAIDVIPASAQPILLRFAGVVGRNLKAWVEANVLANDRQRYIWEMMDIVMATIVGFLRHGLLTDPRGLEAIDDYDVRDWLRANGASERALSSPYIQGLYDLAMAYEDGDPARPGIAAGQGMRGGLRLFFTYRGALVWRMRAGMGDVVFAPLYLALKARGVRFAYFHRLTNVGLSGAMGPSMARHVAALDFDVQAELISGADYDPLIEVAGRPCWPAQPKSGQLVNGTLGVDFESHWDRTRVRTERLQVTRDFDFVVLGVGIGAIPYVAAELVASNPQWAQMVANVKTIATQAFQIWIDKDLEGLGWSGPARLTSAFVKPFDSWCDMGHVIPEEGWSTASTSDTTVGRPRKRPATAVYFCGTLPDVPGTPVASPAQAKRRDEVRANAVHFLTTTARPLWPRAYDNDGAFCWNLLADPVGSPSATATTAEARFLTQYWRANVNPSDRYVLSLPGSLKFRISPLDRTYDNLTIAGDWTDCGFNTGCAEAAVMSGRLAAHALSGVPALTGIVGFNHP